MRTGVFILFIFLSVMTKAQLNLNGKIVDSTGVPLAFATVVVKEESLPIGSAYSNEKGDYTMVIPRPGNFTLSVYYVGFTMNESSIPLYKDTTISVILFPSVGSNLQEVLVVNKKLVIEQKVDRLIFNVENSIAATGGDALDALKITPGIAVRNETVTMIGKSNLRVMINDKLIQLSGDELVNFLKSIPVASISKIEIISNPSAKYEAEGNSGLINIKLKTANADSWSSIASGAYVKNTYSTGRGGMGFNYRKNKFSLYSNLAVSEGARQITDQSRMYYPNQLWLNKSPRKVAVSDINGNVGMNYAVSPKWEIGGQYLGDASQYTIFNNSLTTLINKMDFADSTIHTLSRTKENSDEHVVNLNSIINMDTLGRKILFNFDYFIYSKDNNNSFSNDNFLPDQTQVMASHYSAEARSKQTIKNYSAKMDVEYPMRKINLSYGGRASATETTNNIVFYNTTSGEAVKDASRSNSFMYAERNEALYLSGNKKITEKWEVQAGLRAEATQTKGYSQTLEQTHVYDYIKFFPTAYVSYRPTEQHSFALNYGRRINRPNYEQLNPFRIYSNPYFYVEGNPFLQPSFSDNIELSHTHKNINSKIYYSNVKKGFQQLPIVDDATNTQVVTVQNFYQTDMIGLTESVMFNKYDWWESSNSFNIYYSKSSSQSLVTRQKLEAFNAFLATSNDFSLNKSKTVLCNISYWYNFPGSADLAENTSFSQLDIALKFLLLKNKLTVAISGNDILYTNRPVYTLYSNDIKVEYRNYYDDRSLRISLSYKFGNTTVHVDEREIGNSDERNRIGN